MALPKKDDHLEWFELEIWTEQHIEFNHLEWHFIRQVLLLIPLHLSLSPPFDFGLSFIFKVKHF